MYIVALGYLLTSFLSDWPIFFLTDIKSNLKLSQYSIKVSLFSFWLTKKWLDRTFILLWTCTLNSLEVVFVGMLAKLNIEKASKILKRLWKHSFCVSFGHAMDCFFYLLVYLQITYLQSIFQVKWFLCIKNLLQFWFCFFNVWYFSRETQWPCLKCLTLQLKKIILLLTYTTFQ